MPRKPKSSQYRGVSWHKVHRKWLASFYVPDPETGKVRQKFAGLHPTELDAAQAYNAAAIAALGDKAILNDLPDDPPPPSEDEIAARAAAIRARRFAGQQSEVTFA